MIIKVWVKDCETGKILEELGTCMCDNIARALDLYNDDEIWAGKGYNTDIAYKVCDQPSSVGS